MAATKRETMDARKNVVEILSDGSRIDRQLCMFEGEFYTTDVGDGVSIPVIHESEGVDLEEVADQLLLDCEWHTRLRAEFGEEWPYLWESPTPDRSDWDWEIDALRVHMEEVCRPFQK